MVAQRKVSVDRVASHATREHALRVLDSVYRDEKGWTAEPGRLLPEDDLTRDGVAWFVAHQDGRPRGVVRVLFDLPLGVYRSYGLKFLSSELDIERLLREYRIAEVGRFAVLPEHRGDFLIAAHLMRAVAREALTRAATHLVTDVFEDDPNSPYRFHSRVLGFQTVATHEHGELNARGRRITMLLDIKRAYEELRAKRSWVFRFIAEGWQESEEEPSLACEA